MTPRRALRRFSPALAATLVLAVAGCGEEDPRLLSEGRSETLLDLLDDAEKQFEDGECEELAATLEEFAQQVNEVQGEVDENVRTALRDESQELVNLQDECEPPEEPTVPVEPTVPPPTETLPPTTTETVAPPTTETTEEETVEEEPPEDGAQGNGPDGEGPPGQQPPEAESDGSSGRGDGGEE